MGELLTLTAVEGIEVGHWTNQAAATGCTVILCREGAVGGVDVRGSAPGTRETDLLRPMNLVQEAHAVLLTGGSAYGLAAATGIMSWLEARRIGFPVGIGVVPIVPAAVLFDLGIGSAVVRPDASAGYAACEAASHETVREGCVGAGTGATVGKLFGPQYATKGGLGSAAHRIGGADGITVGALVAVNAAGDVIDPTTNRIVAGCRNLSNTAFIDIMAHWQNDPSPTRPPTFPTNTTIAVVATDALLSKEATNKIAQMAHDGLARSIRPVHTMNDGDTVFALATGRRTGVEPNVSVIGAVAAVVLAEAVLRAVRQATSLAGLPAARDLPF